MMDGAYHNQTYYANCLLQDASRNWVILHP
jgi:hypothetical protein